MGVKYLHSIDYSCPYENGHLSFHVSLDLEQTEEITDFSELCLALKSYGEEGIKATGYFASKSGSSTYKNIVKIKCVDGINIEPVFESKNSVQTRAAVSTPKVTVLNTPAKLADSVIDKAVTLSCLDAFKKKCDENYVNKKTPQYSIYVENNELIIKKNW